jgi:hypothetical protein
MLFLRLLLPPRGNIIRPSNVLLWLGYLFIVWFFRASDSVFENTVVVGAAATQDDHGCVCARPVATQINSCVISLFKNTKPVSEAQVTQILSAYLHLTNRREVQRSDSD